MLIINLKDIRVDQRFGYKKTNIYFKQKTEEITGIDHFQDNQNE